MYDEATWRSRGLTCTEGLIQFTKTFPFQSINADLLLSDMFQNYGVYLFLKKTTVTPFKIAKHQTNSRIQQHKPEKKMTKLNPI